LWVTDKKTSKHHVYEHDKSSTYVANGTKFNIAYGSGPASGFYSNDVVHIGGHKIKHYTFAEVNSTIAMTDSMDGICGMGLDDISVDGVMTPLRALINSKELSENVFAFYLGSGGAKGELVLGGVDPAHYTGDFTYHPVIETSPGKFGLWAMNMDDVKITGESYTSVRKAIVDSGTSFIVVPTADIAKIATRVGATKVAPIPPTDGEYKIDCNAALPNVDFVIGGKIYTLTKEDYTLRAGGSCVFAFQAMDIPAPMGPLYILGDVFMRAHYVKHDVDNMRLGFAQSKKTTTVEIVV